MTENSMFFSDGSWYPQNVFARFIKDIFGEGVVDGIDDELAVSANTPANMAVQVATGRSYVKGYIHEILTDPVTLTIADADPTNPRIDRIVLRLDVNTNRRIRVAVLQGTAAASPVAPTLTQTDSIWELSLAQVYVSANATVINTANITDERTFMTFQRANQPLTSTTAYGAVKIGTGLAVSNGVISVDTAVVCPNISTTNNDGFKIGEHTVKEPSVSYSSSALTTGYSKYFEIALTESTKNCQPFNFESFTSSSTVTVPSISVEITSSATTMSQGKNVYIRAVRESTSAILASTSAKIGASGTLTMSSFTLPSDWSYSTDKIGVYLNVESTEKNHTLSAGTISASTLLTESIYYNPVVSN